ncbi:Protein CBG26464 [Caenorhabditis briggsae]|uniref:Protein CBG26464 n=1 Tax=Caenorhabditis briggsae TaxID=6238 RepID=B6IFR1_CAEBR|nr:Protein CBG26464 [Caenorhabditis briggsae]CAR98741.1 Protein CBG26464 [Caenorhabditis briggsae]
MENRLKRVIGNTRMSTIVPKRRSVVASQFHYVIQNGRFQEGEERVNLKRNSFCLSLGNLTPFVITLFDLDPQTICPDPLSCHLAPHTAGDSECQKIE